MPRILVQFRPKPDVKGCQPIDHFIDVQAGAGFAEVFNEAVDYLQGLYESGAKYSRNLNFCPPSSYYIDPGPTLGL